MTNAGGTGCTRRGALVAIGSATLAATVPATAAAPRPLLLRRADHVLTMAGAPLANADLLVREGRIEAIGPELSAPDADTIDLTGHVLLPGFVDTHWHMWNTALRGLARSGKGGFAPTMAAVAPLFSPADAAIGVELALAEAVNSGITTVHNWAHNTRSPDHAAAEVAAMVDSGVRGRFAYGYPQDAPHNQMMDLPHLASIGGTPPSDLVSLGICARGPDRSAPEVWRAEWAAARRLGLPISTHMASDAKAAALGGIAALAAADGLGPDVQLVHLTGASPADMARVAEARSPVSISPWTELAVGYGVPPVAELLKAKLLIGLSVDNMVLAGSADMFAVMRLATDLARGTAHDQLVVGDDTALRWATLDGAHSLGLSKKIGTLAIGKRADLIAVRLDAVNTAPAPDLPAMLAHAARPENVALVLIDGVAHKREGKLVKVDLPRLIARADRLVAKLQQARGI